MNKRLSLVHVCTLVVVLVTLLPASQAQERLTTHDAAAADAAFDAAHGEQQRPERYTLDPATGRRVLTAAGRAAAEAFAASRPHVEVVTRPSRPRAARIQPAAPVYRSGAIVYTVNSAYDDDLDTNLDGVCSTDEFSECQLRAAITEANAQPTSAPVRIEFAITVGPGGVGPDGEWIIPVNESGFGPLPLITRLIITIDALTQPGASCGNLVAGNTHALRVILDGSATTSGSGLDATEFAAFNTIRGLVVQNFAFGFGITVRSNGSLVECNYAGTDYTGETAAGNLDGIEIRGEARNNVASGNATDGIVTWSGSVPITVSRNLAGSDDDGEQPLGNGRYGIHVRSPDATITTNLASANGNTGIWLSAPGGTLTNNTVGLARVRTDLGLGNGFYGIRTDPSPFANADDIDIGLPGNNNGNFIGANGNIGLYVDNESQDVRVRNNVIGLTLAGTAAPNGIGVLPFNAGGIYARSGPLTIGGPGPTEGNIIAGNGANGITMFLINTVVIEGNTIGLNAAGDARPNMGDGIEFIGAFDITVRDNTISSNTGVGVRADGDLGFAGSTERLTLDGNRIGTDPTGTLPRGNTLDGVAIRRGDEITMLRNTVSANGNAGVLLQTPDFSGGDFVLDARNNFIGTNAAGADLGNGLAGVLCRDAEGVRLGQNFQPNTIAFNGGDGIFLADSDCQDISIVGNYISANDELAVDLDTDGVTLNDPGDVDGGANGRLNFPVITSAENDGTGATIEYTVSSTANTTFELLFCRVTTPDPSGHGECRFPNALETVTTDGAGLAFGTLTTAPGAYPVGSFVTANATVVSGTLPAGYGPTSEFAQNVEVEVSGGSGEITLVASNTTPLTVPRGGSVGFEYTVTNGTAASATGQSWYRARTAGGSTVAQGVLTDGTLPAGQSVDVTYTQAVPSNAPLGNYTFCLRTGIFPNNVVAEECFTVTVTAARLAGRDARSMEDEWAAMDIVASEPSTPEGLAEPETLTEGEGTSGAPVLASSSVPSSFALHGAYPNPFNPSATLRFDVPEATVVRLSVYDALGREVAVLVNSRLEAGSHTAVFAAGALPSGVYLARLTSASGFTQVQRLTLLR